MKTRCRAGGGFALRAPGSPHCGQPMLCPQTDHWTVCLPHEQRAAPQRKVTHVCFGLLCCVLGAVAVTARAKPMAYQWSTSSPPHKLAPRVPTAGDSVDRARPSKSVFSAAKLEAHTLRSAGIPSGPQNPRIPRASRAFPSGGPATLPRGLRGSLSLVLCVSAIMGCSRWVRRGTGFPLWSRSAAQHLRCNWATMAASAAGGPPGPKKRKPRRKKAEEEAPPPMPQHFQTVWDRIVRMRRQVMAPVDTMGCERLADPRMDPATQRYHHLTALMLSSQTRDEATAEAMQRLLEKVNSLPPMPSPLPGLRLWGTPPPLRP